jgi:glyoxylate reductase
MPRPHVYVTRRIPQPALDLLAQHLSLAYWPSETEPVPPEALRQELAQADGVLSFFTDRWDQERLGWAPQLKVLANMAVGYDNIDVAACTQRGILVTNTPGVLTETTADLAFALLLATARRIPEADKLVRFGGWTGIAPLFMAGQAVHGATLGIIGMGRIGQAVARRAKGFGMRIRYHNRRLDPAAETELGAEYRSLDDLLRESDFVVILTPRTPETTGLIGARELGLMKRTACLINVARGGIVDEAALYQALVSGQIWAAGLDVWAEEPVPADHPLLSLPNLVALPHIGSATIQTRTAMAVLAAENLVAALTGRTVPSPVNPEVLAN